jgi:hypothetical protein
MTEAQIPYIVGAIKALDGIASRPWTCALTCRNGTTTGWSASWAARCGTPAAATAGICAHGRGSALWPDYTWRFRRLLGRFDLRYHQLGRTP